MRPTQTTIMPHHHIQDSIEITITITITTVTLLYPGDRKGQLKWATFLQNPAIIIKDEPMATITITTITGTIRSPTTLGLLILTIITTETIIATLTTDDISLGGVLMMFNQCSQYITMYTFCTYILSVYFPKRVYRCIFPKSVKHLPAPNVSGAQPSLPLGSSSCLACRRVSH